MSNELPRTALPLEKYQNYLLVSAGRLMSVQLQRKVDPSDMIQETYLRALRGAPCHGDTDAQIAAWLKKILLRVILDELDHRNPDPETRSRINLVPDSALSPEDQAERIEEAMLLANALMQLAPRQRQAIILQKFHGLSVAEVAREMETTSAAVGGLLRHGMNTLRSLVA